MAKESWQMTYEEFRKGGTSVPNAQAKALLGMDVFRKHGDVSYVVGERYRDFSGTTWQIVGHNDLNVPYVVKVTGGKPQKKRYVGHLWDVHKVIVTKALREGKTVPPEVLKEYPKLEASRGQETKRMQPQPSVTVRSSKPRIHKTRPSTLKGVRSVSGVRSIW